MDFLDLARRKGNGLSELGAFPAACELGYQIGRKSKALDH